LNGVDKYNEPLQDAQTRGQAWKNCEGGGGGNCRKETSGRQRNMS